MTKEKRKHKYNDGSNNIINNKNSLTLVPVIILIKYAVIIKRSEYIKWSINIKMDPYLIHLSINGSI